MPSVVLPACPLSPSLFALFVAQMGKRCRYQRTTSSPGSGGAGAPPLHGEHAKGTRCTRFLMFSSFFFLEISSPQSRGGGEVGAPPLHGEHAKGTRPLFSFPPRSSQNALAPSPPKRIQNL